MKESLFFCMIWLSWITWSWTNTAIGFCNNLFITQIFIRTVSPKLSTYTGMHAFRKGFRITISKGLNHNGLIGIFLEMSTLPKAIIFYKNRDGKAPDIIQFA